MADLLVEHRQRAVQRVEKLPHARLAAEEFHPAGNDTRHGRGRVGIAKHDHSRFRKQALRQPDAGRLLQADRGGAGHHQAHVRVGCRCDEIILGLRFQNVVISA